MAVSSRTRATARAGKQAGAKANAADGRARGGRAKERGGAAAQLSNERLLELYRKMLLIRLFEEASQRAFRQGKSGGYLHVYIGEEAVATGFLDTYREGDKVITAYRDHAHALLLVVIPHSALRTPHSC